MRVFDESKTTELTEYDLSVGYLKPDKLFIAHHEAQEAVEGQFHYETIKEYPNGGKDVKKVWDVHPQEAHEAYDEYENIFVYIPYTAAEQEERLKEELRIRRASECFPIINRGKLWYDKLTAEQQTELSAWYEAWLDVTQTKIVPEAPDWINSKLQAEVI